jgi:hypothetical protein
MFPISIKGKRYWRVAVPLHPGGYRDVTFRWKGLADKYVAACRIELRPTKRVDLLSSRQALVDAIEAASMLKALSGRRKHREAAALLLESREAIAKLKGEKPGAPYTEPASRAVELPPALYQALVNLARGRGMSLGDFVCGGLLELAEKGSQSRIPPTGKEDVGEMQVALYQKAA